MFSAHNGHVGAVRLLLELGADPNAVRVTLFEASSRDVVLLEADPNAV